MERSVATGFCDSAGKPIHVGDTVRKKVTCNQQFHGAWADYAVKQQGLAPMLSYQTSQKGQKLPEGYTGCWLTDCYDLKLALFTCRLNELTPNEKMLIVDADLQWDEHISDEIEE